VLGHILQSYAGVSEAVDGNFVEEAAIDPSVLCMAGAHWAGG
jgi:hypothetical protein